jgi:hypothetical protein
MQRDYFERLHREESRHAEWHRLDAALSVRPRKQRRFWQRLRVVAGNWMLPFKAFVG